MPPQTRGDSLSGTFALTLSHYSPTSPSNCLLLLAIVVTCGLVLMRACQTEDVAWARVRGRVVSFIPHAPRSTASAPACASSRSGPRLGLPWLCHAPDVQAAEPHRRACMMRLPDARAEQLQRRGRLGTCGAADAQARLLATRAPGLGEGGPAAGAGPGAGERSTAGRSAAGRGERGDKAGAAWDGCQVLSVRCQPPAKRGRASQWRGCLEHTAAR